MRVGTVVGWAAGAAMGAAGTWLLDPEVGPERRRAALRSAWARGREVDWVELARRAGTLAEGIGQRAAEGYREGVTAGE